jgi:uncharacterized glyoxalase superfamily protein PhnB
MTEERDPLDPLRQLRPDRLQSPDHNDPWILAEERNRLMAMIDKTATAPVKDWHSPAIYPRIGYLDEIAAIEYLQRVFGFRERREARMGEPPEHVLAWLEHGDGVVMLGHSEHEVHGIYSPQETGGHGTCMLNVRVVDIDAHYAKAIEAGADITMEINDAFYGERRYEARDLEGHGWHFGESLADIERRQSP